ncbi:ER membrane protein complex subunit 4 [Schistosoma japonicum]|nr:ER membrane protein complex subunit 4 [Schistosoma japonicum]
MMTCISFDENSIRSFLSRKWALDFNSKARATAPNQANATELKHPPGYVDRSFPATAVRDSDPHLMRQRSWNIALGPFRQVPMNLFIMWISGSSISIFPLMSVIMLFLRPLQALFSAQASRSPFQSFLTVYFGRSYLINSSHKAATIVCIVSVTKMFMLVANFSLIMVMKLKRYGADFFICRSISFNLIEGSQATIQCFVYVLGNLVILTLAMYKCHTMGLLPTYASDWLSFVEPRQTAEWSVGGFVV